MSSWMIKHGSTINCCSQDRHAPLCRLRLHPSCLHTRVESTWSRRTADRSGSPAWSSRIFPANLYTFDLRYVFRLGAVGLGGGNRRQWRGRDRGFVSSPPSWATCFSGLGATRFHFLIAGLRPIWWLSPIIHVLTSQAWSQPGIN